MQYSAKIIQWAPFAATNPESASSFPKYGAPQNLGALNNVAEQLNYADLRAYGDDVCKIAEKEFTDGLLTVETLELSNKTAAALTGNTLSDEEADDLEFSSEDLAPFGGVAFVTGWRRANGTRYYQGVWFPKVKANMEGQTYSTRGQTTTLANSRLSFVVLTAANGKHKVVSPEFSTEAEAVAWVNGKIKASV